MPLAALLAAIPDHAEDVRRSLAAVLADSPLTDQQLWGTALACAVAAREPAVTAVFATEAERRLAPAAVAAAKSAAAVMAMNNVYYRAKHQLGPDYDGLPARLSMRVTARPGVDRADFELWALAVSAIAGCEVCLRNHDGKLRAAGVEVATAHEALRVAAAVHAAAVVLGAERATRESPGLPPIG
ncbi:carboxymuconolactone decarboxylase family protein [Actinokineospora guangxiensis]|uniref:Alkyl hydroperoxide reductase AhpD n=1 Tax=Actinokineospora guangxiensis TaxID=1490288 RepID=A0ABW0EL19_9PSEU